MYIDPLPLSDPHKVGLITQRELIPHAETLFNATGVVVAGVQEGTLALAVELQRGSYTFEELQRLEPKLGPNL